MKIPNNISTIPKKKSKKKPASLPSQSKKKCTQLSHPEKKSPKKKKNDHIHPKKNQPRILPMGTRLHQPAGDESITPDEHQQNRTLQTLHQLLYTNIAAFIEQLAQFGAENPSNVPWYMPKWATRCYDPRYPSLIETLVRHDEVALVGALKIITQKRAYRTGKPEWQTLGIMLVKFKAWNLMTRLEELGGANEIMTTTDRELRSPFHHLCLMEHLSPATLKYLHATVPAIMDHATNPDNTGTSPLVTLVFNKKRVEVEMLLNLAPHLAGRALLYKHAPMGNVFHVIFGEAGRDRTFVRDFLKCMKQWDNEGLIGCTLQALVFPNKNGLDPRALLAGNLKLSELCAAILAEPPFAESAPQSRPSLTLSLEGVWLGEDEKKMGKEGEE